MRNANPIRNWMMVQGISADGCSSWMSSRHSSSWMKSGICPPLLMIIVIDEEPDQSSPSSPTALSRWFLRSRSEGLMYMFAVVATLECPRMAATSGTGVP